MAASQHAIERSGRGLLPPVNPDPFGNERKTTRTKFFGTFITVVWMQVISSAIFLLVSAETVVSSVIAVSIGICMTPIEAAVSMKQYSSTVNNDYFTSQAKRSVIVATCL